MNMETDDNMKLIFKVFYKALTFIAMLAFVSSVWAARGPGPGPGPGPDPGPSPGPAGKKYEVRIMPNGNCHVERAAAGADRGKRIAGPFPNRARAQEAMIKLPRCK